mgnify:FL=1
MYQLPPLPTRKKPRPAYRKSEAVKHLERLYLEDHRKRYAAMPEYARAGNKYRDDTAGGLTKCIVAYAKLCGCFASRLNNQGVYRAGKWTRSTSRRGLPDVLITRNGISYFIEVKVGRDTMSEHQHKVKQDQQQAGGIYFVAHDFGSFKSFFDQL